MKRLLMIVALGAFFLAPATTLAKSEAHAEAPEGHGSDGVHHAPGGDINFADFSYKDEHKDPPLLLALVNFALLLALLGWKAAPALRDYWAKKSDSIRDGLEEGERLQKEAKAKLEEYGQRIKDVEREVDELITDIRAEAEAEKKRLLEEAEVQAKATKKAADERIAAEIARARTEIEREVVATAIRTAEKLLKDNVGAADQQKLVDGFISNMESSKPLGTRGGFA